MHLVKCTDILQYSPLPLFTEYRKISLLCTGNKSRNQFADSNYPGGLRQIFYEFSITLLLSSCSSEDFSRNGFSIFRFYMGENELEFRYWRFYSKFTYCNYNYRYSCVLDRNRKNRKEFLSFYSKKIPQDR